MADLRRFSVFADFLIERFDARRVFDVAGGMGKLNEALTARGADVLTFDRRHRRLDVPYAQRGFTLDEPCEAELVVGMHPDGATRVIIEYAALHHISFAVVPCCSDNGMSYNPWMRHLTEYARAQGFDEVGEQVLPITGRARVLYGRKRSTNRIFCRHRARVRLAAPETRRAVWTDEIERGCSGFAVRGGTSRTPGGC